MKKATIGFSGLTANELLPWKQHFEALASNVRVSEPLDQSMRTLLKFITSDMPVKPTHNGLTNLVRLEDCIKYSDELDAVALSRSQGCLKCKPTKNQLHIV